MRQVEYMPKLLVYLAHKIEQRHSHTRDTTTRSNHRHFEERPKESKPRMTWISASYLDWARK